MFYSPWYFLLLLLVPLIAWRLFVSTGVACGAIQQHQAGRHNCRRLCVSE